MFAAIGSVLREARPSQKRDAPGVTVHEPAKAGIDANGESVYSWFLGTGGEVTFKDCKVPGANLLGTAHDRIELSIMQYVLIVIVSVVGSAATAGTTGATVMLTLTLSTLGLPLEGVGLLLAIDPILDMGRTATNVAGQILVPMIVAKREGILEEPLPEGVLAEG